MHRGNRDSFTGLGARLLAAALTVAALGGAATPATAAPAAAAPVGAADDGGLTARASALVSGEARSAEGRVVGGRPTAINEVPWQVMVWTGRNDVYMDCGGSILGPDKILTAAHCVDTVNPDANPNNGGAAVWAGISHLDEELHTSSDNFQERRVTALRIHPSYRKGLVSSSGDLAVLTVFPAFVPDDDAIRPIALAPPQVSTDGLRPALGPDVLLSGYGKQAEEFNPSGRLFSLPTKIVSSDLCPDQSESALELCVQVPLGNACSGDSGGPLVLPGAVPLLVGVVSNGPRDCRPGGWSGYADVTVPEHRIFIDGSMTPPRAPRQQQGISITWDRPGWPAGSVVTCKGGAWSEAPRVIWTITNDQGAMLASGPGAELNYTLQRSDIGRTVSCRAHASNAGGVQTTPPASLGPVTAYVPPLVPKISKLATSTKIKRGKAYLATVMLSEVASQVDGGKATLSLSGWKVIGGTTKYRPMAAGGAVLTFKYRVPKKVKRGKLFKLGINVDLLARGQSQGKVAKTVRVRVK